MTRELKIGFFVGGAAIVLAVFIFIVGDLTVLFKKPGYPLYVSFDSVSGLETNAVVRMAGLKIGYIKEIKLVGRKPRVFMSISPKFQALKRSRATQAALGLLGEKYIEIMPGESEDYCRPGDEIEGIPSVGFDQLGPLLVSVGDEIKEAGKAIRGLAGKDTQSDLHQALRNLVSVTEDFSAFLESGGGEFRDGIRGVSRATRNIDKTMAELAGEMEKTVGLLRDIAGENRDNIRENLEKVKELLSRMEDSLKQLSDLLEKVNKGEGTMGKLVRDDRLYDEARETLGDVRGLGRTLAGFRAGVGLRTDYLGEAGKLRNALSFNLSQPSGNFFLGQIVRDPRDGRFTYSAQGGKRWGGLAPRAGIVESTFGAGLEYFALADRLVFNLEGFDLVRDEGPRFRFSTAYSFHKHIYLVVGIDDFSLAARRQVFFGLGLESR